MQGSARLPQLRTVIFFLSFPPLMKEVQMASGLSILGSLLLKCEKYGLDLIAGLSLPPSFFFSSLFFFLFFLLFLIFLLFFSSPFLLSFLLSFLYLLMFLFIYIIEFNAVGTTLQLNTTTTSNDYLR